MKLSRKLSPAVVESAKPEAVPYRIWDTVVPQLFVRVMPSGVKSWNVAWHRQGSRSIGKVGHLSVDGARTQARKLLADVAEQGAPKAEVRDTVADACRDYVAWLRKEGRASAALDAERRFDRSVYHDRLGRMKLSKLAQDDLEDWRDRITRGDLGDLPSRKGRSPETKALSKSSANRMRTPLVAALNRAVSRRKVSQERAIEWGSVKPYKDAHKRRELYLDLDQRRALVAHATGDLRDLIECAALTGCRAGDPKVMLRSDYDSRTGTATFRAKGSVRSVALTPRAKELFDRLARGKLPNAHLFSNGGAKWTANEWGQGFRAVATSAGLPNEVVLGTLRHCWITDALIAGFDLLTVSRMAGTSPQIIHKTYGHLVDSNVREKLAGVSFL